MQIPVVSGLIERRILVNYCADREVVRSMLPAPFRPKTVHGFGVVGICLIRLSELRPAHVPRWLGVASENAAHRIAVEWDDRGSVREGVYIPRRDTNSKWNRLVGGRLFPGIHHCADFRVEETVREICVSLRSVEDQTHVAVRGSICEQLPVSSIFQTMEQASNFFKAGSLGYSATRDCHRLEGLELRCRSWRVEPLEVTELRSSLFDDEAIFPSGSIEFDCALVMRNIEHEWHSRPYLQCEPACVDLSQDGKPSPSHGVGMLARC